MNTLRTLGRVLAGFILACLVAGLVQVLYVETPKELAAIPAGELPNRAQGTVLLSLLTATHFAVFSCAFVLIAAGIAEWLSLRSPVYWLSAGTGIALLGFVAQYASEVAGQPSILNNYALQAYLTAGFFGGLAYWLVAGMHSGRVRLPEGVVADDQTFAIAQPAKRETVLKKGSLAEKLALKRSKALAPAAEDAAAPSKPAPPPAPVTSGTAVPVTKARLPGKKGAPSEA